MKRILLYVAGTILALPILMVLIYLVFGTDYEVRLPDGYSLVRIYSGSVVIGDPNNIVVVPANVEVYQTHGTAITGLVTRHSGLTPDDWKDSRPGYFIVDTRTGKVQLGLSESSWRTALRSYGIEKVRLHKPSRFDTFW